MSKSGNPMSDIEHKMSLEPIEDLMEQRNLLVNKVAPLRAKYGPFGTAENLRKIELARIKGLIRAQITLEHKKKSNEQIDDEAHGHDDYVKFVTQMTVERDAWVRIEEAINDIDAVVMRGQACARFLAAEARLQQ